MLHKKLISVGLSLLALGGSRIAVAQGHNQVTPEISIPANAAHHPWTGNCSILPAANGNYASCVIPVPAGEEVVVEMVTTDLYLNGPSHLFTQVSPTIGGVTSYWISMQPPISVNGVDYYRWSSPAAFYSDPGSSIVVLIRDQGVKIKTLGGTGITLTGYWVAQGAPAKAGAQRSSSGPR